jgi:hypothetical protein
MCLNGQSNSKSFTGLELGESSITKDDKHGTKYYIVRNIGKGFD